MPRRSKKKTKPLKEANVATNILQSNKNAVRDIVEPEKTQTKDFKHDEGDLKNIKSILDDENCQPSTSSVVDEFNTNTAALYDEIDSFLQRWKRELENKKPDTSLESKPSDSDKPAASKSTSDDCSKLAGSLTNHGDNIRLNDENDDTESSRETYAKARKLFLTALKLEQDDMHYESIRYYKQAMHLCPDIENKIFQEQCEASAKDNPTEKQNNSETSNHDKSSVSNDNVDDIPLLERIRQSYYEDDKNREYTHCRPATKLKQNTVHISDLPLELIMKIFRYVIGEDLDLSSLETLGLVCRSFYLLSKDQLLWRSICFTTWGDATLDKKASASERKLSLQQIDWRQMFLERPRVNYDGVYISRTRYIRQGDAGFQDVTYRPFHVIRYYRYFRFFPDSRVLILTTNEEPDKIVPIFRHASHSKHFSPELSVLEGTYEFINAKQISLVAEKDCRASLAMSNNQRRQAQFYWSRQTPLTLKFKMKFELKTVENRPYLNNVLKWLDYTILTRLETGEEVTSFDLSPDTFPNLSFSRVKRFNLRIINPLPSF